MMEKGLNVLILEDLPSDAELAKRELKKVLNNPIFKIVDTEEDYVDALQSFSPKLIISDYQLPAFDGMSALKITKERFPFIPFVILTGSMNEDTAVQCMKSGADDYVIKEHIKRLGSAALSSIAKKKIEIEHHKTEIALKESEEKYKTLFEAANDAIILADPVNENILDLNNKALELTGYSRDELIGQHQSFILPQYNNKKYKNSFNETAKKNNGSLNEVDVLCKNGSIVPVEISSGEEINIAGKVVHFGSFRNITERKKAEQKLVAALNKATESDRLKTAFLTNMSHEIRTPMNGILGFTNLLKKPNLTGDKQIEYINIINKSGKRMLNIINDIIDISKIESGLVEINNTETNINEQIEYIYNFFKPESNAKGLDIYFKNTLPTNEVIIYTDTEKLAEILTNLVKNSIKYTEEGLIELGYEKKGNYLEFFVKDTGIGIPKDRQSAVFERFIQADISDKRAFQGAGLGLSITKAYVEMLGGKIWLGSEEENPSIGKKGFTKFYFTIPYKQIKDIKKTENKELTKNSIQKISNLKFLIVEDDLTSRQFLTEIICDKCEKILHASNGKDAVNICKNNPDIDLVLMDIKLPELDGYAATQQIRQFNKDVIIIAQTAFGFLCDKEKALEAGCNDYISKPISQDLLLELIEMHLKK